MVSPFDAGDIETISFDELLRIPGGEPIALKLLHNALFEHLRSKGLQVEYDRRRAWFARGDEPEVKITYQGRVRKATRTVVKARRKRDSENIAYYEHKAVSFSVMRFGADWALTIAPGYMFTRDGVRNPISRERTNILSTRRAALDFNPSVLQDVSFWAAVMSGEAQGLFALETEEKNDLHPFGPTILLSHRTPTISFNASAFGGAGEVDGELEDDLKRLDDELEALAALPEDSEAAGTGPRGSHDD
jgi:hypothetical protein